MEESPAKKICTESPTDRFRNIILCPITHEILNDPVILSDGITYEKEAVIKWFETAGYISPVTRSKVDKDILPNIAIRQIISEYIEANPTEFLNQYTGIFDFNKLNHIINQSIEMAYNYLLKFNNILVDSKIFKILNHFTDNHLCQLIHKKIFDTKTLLIQLCSCSDIRVAKNICNTMQILNTEKFKQLFVGYDGSIIDDLYTNVNIDCVKYLLKYFITNYFVEVFYCSNVYFIAHNKNSDAIKFIINTLKIYKVSLYTVLSEVCRINNDDNIIKYVIDLCYELKYNMNIISINSPQYTALTYLCIRHKPALVKYIIERGADTLVPILVKSSQVETEEIYLDYCKKHKKHPSNKNIHNKIIRILRKPIIKRRNSL